MATDTLGTRSIAPRSLETDLASLASQAAIEVDNILLDRSTQTSAIARLATRLEEYTQKSGEGESSILLRPTKVVVVHHALSNSRLINNRLESASQFSDETHRVVQRLKALTERPVSDEMSDLEKLRAFCLELAKAAAPRQVGSASSRSNHPYRR